MARRVAGEIDKVAQELAAHADANLQGDRRAARRRHRRRCSAAIDWMVPAYGTQPRAAHAVAVPYLKLWGLVAGGWQLGRGALAAARRLADGTGDARFLTAKIADGALLRGSAAAAGRGPRAVGDGRRRVGAGARRRSVLSRR